MKMGLSKFTIGTLGGFLVGIFVAGWIPLDLWWTVGVTVGIIVGLILFWHEVLWRWVLFCLLGLFLGLGYYYLYDDIQNKKIVEYGKASIIGMVDERPEINGAKQNIIISYNKTKILIHAPRYPEYKYADFLEIKGTIQNPAEIEPFNNFDYGKYLLHRGIRGLIQNPESISITNQNTPRECVLQVGFYQAIYFVGDKFQISLNKILPEPYAALQSGLILGSKTSNIPDSLTSAFNPPASRISLLFRATM